jgi:hypothetical protein
MSGSSPIVNKGIGRLPDETTGLAAFANAFVICLFLYSPCFAVRDLAQKLVRGRTSYRQVLFFNLCVSTACTGLLLVISLTPLLDGLLLRGVMSLPPDLMGPVKRAVLAFVAMPTLIVLRGVHQAAHITNDTPRWIGIGTACRFVMLTLTVFAIGVPLGLEGGVIGGLAFGVGMATETVVNVVTARRMAPWLRKDHAERPPTSYGYLWALAGPLFLANAMGVLLQPLAMSIVNGAISAETSAAAFGVVKSFTWFFVSTLFAMQAMSLAKADSVPNLRRLLVYELIPVGTFTTLIFVASVIPPARTALLESFFEIDDVSTLAFIRETLPYTLVLPFLMALRSTARGLLIRGGRTSWVTLASLVALALLFALNARSPSAALENGATIGYLCWIGAMAAEMAVLLIGVARVGVATCVNEG